MNTTHRDHINQSTKFDLVNLHKKIIGILNVKNEKLPLQTLTRHIDLIRI
jgi:hypothetical protein